MKTYRLYVPAGNSYGIISGSAIVGNYDENLDLISTHYEGGKYSNTMPFEEKIYHAASRRIEKYPTVAKQNWALDELLDVGEVKYDENLRTWVISEVTNKEALKLWLGHEDIPALYGSEKLKIDKIGYLFTKLDPVDQAIIMSKKLNVEDLCNEVIAASKIEKLNND